MATDQTHNGWTNYATWRVHLEFFDGRDSDRHATPESVKAEVEEYIDEVCPGQPVNGWASAFVSGVNWDEIAEAVRGDEDETDEDEEG